MTFDEAVACDRDPGVKGSVRWYYRVGVLVWPAFTDWIVLAEAAGVTVIREHRRGVLVREGWVRLDGPWGAVRRAMLLWRQIEGPQ